MTPSRVHPSAYDHRGDAKAMQGAGCSAESNMMPATMHMLLSLCEPPRAPRASPCSSSTSFASAVLNEPPWQTAVLGRLLCSCDWQLPLCKCGCAKSARQPAVLKRLLCNCGWQLLCRCGPCQVYLAACCARAPPLQLWLAACLQVWVVPSLPGSLLCPAGAVKWPAVSRAGLSGKDQLKQLLCPEGPAVSRRC